MITNLVSGFFILILSVENQICLYVYKDVHNPTRLSLDKRGMNIGFNCVPLRVSGTIWEERHFGM